MHRFAIGYALLAAVLFGAAAPLSKLLLQDVEPLALAGMLYLSAGLGLTAIYVALRLWWPARLGGAIRRSDLPWLTGAVVSGGIVAPVLLLVGLHRTNGAAASLLLNLEVVATMTIAWTIAREHVDRRLVTGALAILAGAIVLAWRGGEIAFDWGALAIAAACIGWGIDNNLTRRLSGADPVQVAAIKGIVAGLVNCGLAAGLGAELPGAAILASGFVVGLLGYGVSLALFVLALRHLGTGRTSAYFATAPFVGAVLSLPFLQESVTPQMAGAAALMAFGVYLHATERHAHLHSHEPLVHEHSHRHDEHHQHRHAEPYDGREPHRHVHAHEALVHEHPHYPDLHHRHPH